jgi:hypothetical protein
VLGRHRAGVRISEPTSSERQDTNRSSTAIALVAAAGPALADRQARREHLLAIEVAADGVARLVDAIERASCFGYDCPMATPDSTVVIASTVVAAEDGAAVGVRVRQRRSRSWPVSTRS